MIMIIIGEIASIRPLGGWNLIRLPALCLCHYENKARDANGSEETRIRTETSRRRLNGWTWAVCAAFIHLKMRGFFT